MKEKKSDDNNPNNPRDWGIPKLYQIVLSAPTGVRWLVVVSLVAMALVGTLVGSDRTTWFFLLLALVVSVIYHDTFIGS